MAAAERNARRGLPSPAELESLPFPAGMTWIWRVFLDLNTGRGSSAWCSLSRVRLDPTEVEIVKRLDLAFLKAMTAKQ
jgi:hypothetical protein